MALSMSPEPFTAYGVTIRPGPLLPKHAVQIGRWWLKILGSVDDPSQYAYCFVVECVPCNADGSTPCEDKRARRMVTQRVTRLSFQETAAIFELVLQQTEWILEESPMCCIKHALIERWDGTPCIMGEAEGSHAEIPT
jgi:hypothetical protein